jgi:hypothetical protein
MNPFQYPDPSTPIAAPDVVVVVVGAGANALASSAPLNCWAESDVVPSDTSAAAVVPVMILVVKVLLVASNEESLVVSVSVPLIVVTLLVVAFKGFLLATMLLASSVPSIMELAR